MEVEAKMEFQNFAEETAQVEVAVYLPGNAGCNNARMFIDDMEPEHAPGMHLFVIDSDGPLLKERFSPKESVDDNLKKWLSSNKLHLIQLRRSADHSIEKGSFRRHRKLFGAGGDVEAGRMAFQSAAEQIQSSMENKDLVICWGAGGGGTGTAALEEISKIASDKGIPLITILITPFATEGSKIAICENLRKKLRENGRVLVIKNQNLPKEQWNLLPSAALRYINLECRPIFRTLKEYTQVVGSGSNADLEDLLTALEKGRDIYVGIFEAELNEHEKDKIPAVNSDEVITKLRNHAFQEHDIKAQALLFCFRGPWTMAAMDEIISGLQNQIDCSPNIFVKRQNFETMAEMWVSVIIVRSLPKGSRGGR